MSGTGKRQVTGGYAPDITYTLIVAKEKQLVPQKTPSARGSELVLSQRTLSKTIGIVEKVRRI